MLQVINTTNISNVLHFSTNTNCLWKEIKQHLEVLTLKFRLSREQNKIFWFLVISVAQENPRHHYTKTKKKTLKFKANTKTLCLKTMTMTITIANRISHATKVSRPKSLYLNKAITSGNLPQHTVLKQGSLFYKIKNSSRHCSTQLFLSHPIISIKRNINMHFAWTINWLYVHSLISFPYMCQLVLSTHINEFSVCLLIRFRYMY